MSSLYNFSTSIFVIIIIIILILIQSISTFDQQQQQQQTNELPKIRQQFHVPHVDWNFLQRLNQTSAKTILQNEIENLKRLFPFINFHSNSSFKSSTDSFIVLDNNIDDDENDDDTGNNEEPTIESYHHIPLENTNNNDDSSSTTTTTNSNKLIDMNAILFLGLMILILVIITLYLLNSWSSRLDRRASIQTKTADNHKQPDTISV